MIRVSPDCYDDFIIEFSGIGTAHDLCDVRPPIERAKADRAKIPMGFAIPRLTEAERKPAKKRARKRAQRAVPKSKKGRAR